MKLAAFQAVRQGSSDPDWIDFNLCKEFGWLPSEIDQQDWYIIKKFTMFLNASRQNEKAEIDKARKKNK